ncbi:hypothetical protein [Paenibacillus sp. AN1007]|uniref:Uncharacterized protein n=2 Tax=unclassified Paenibacillus TaxID=185978 RepID=A0AAU8N5W0_9BACL
MSSWIRSSPMTREQSRVNRAAGLAHSQYDYVYAYDEYDLEVSTEELSAAACADIILQYMQADQKYSAFKKINRRD